MTKLSLLGTASALALTVVLAQGATAGEPRLLVDDNQANLWSDGNANDSSTITKSYTDNSDSSVRASSDNDKTANNSFNKSYTTNTDNSLRASSDNDTATNNSFNKTASNSFNKSHTTNTDNSVRASSDNDTATNNSFNKSITVSKDERVSETELKAEASEGSVAAVHGNATDSSIGRENSGKIAGRDLNTGTQTDISLGDVMVNLATANAHLDSASMSAALKAGVDTGSIKSVNLNGMHGVAQVSNNTGVAAQANNIALNAIVK